MDYFVKPVDELSRLIEEKARLLYQKISDLPVESLDLPPYPRSYYMGSHHKRRFFSVQTAAELLYRSVKLKGKPLGELCIMDYGAGVGSLFLLAAMIGCRKVIYNDILEDMVTSAHIICDYLEIPVDYFILGDHHTAVKELKGNNIQCDIILSRNVIEHIYDLDDFFRTMSEEQPGALLYNSTTANFHNPAMLLFHKRLHKKVEKMYFPQRKAIIKERFLQLSDKDADLVAEATRGLAMHDLDNALDAYRNNGILPDPSIHYSNTCDPGNGVWQEHIIPVKEYREILGKYGYRFTVLPAFWDTHYSSLVKRAVAKTLNILTRMLGQKGGLSTSPFIYIIAEK